jgi:hypothetical protein
MKRSLFVAVPCYARPEPLFDASMAKLDRTLGRVGIRHIEGGVRMFGESLITRARNRLVAKFLKTDFTDFLFIDSDIGFEAADVLRLIHSEHDLCAAPYPAKLAGGRLIGNPLVKDGNAELVDGFVRAQDLPTGFMLVRRGVFEKLAPSVPEVDDDMPGSEITSYRVFFDVGVDERQYLSEDWWFTRLARLHGYEAWLDAHAKLRHVGTHAFEAESLAEVLGATKEAAE